MTDAHEELLNIYDLEGRVIGARPRREAKASGLAVGAVNALLVNARGEVLLQKRPLDKENGGLWDKSVGGHVSAGEEFDTTLLREAGEELFSDPLSPRVRLCASEQEFASLLSSVNLHDVVLLRRVAFQLALRDVRHAPGGTGLRIVVYHLAIYAGRTEVALEGFSPQASEIDDLRYVPAAQVDALLIDGKLAPNMAYLWLTRGLSLLSGSGAG